MNHKAQHTKAWKFTNMYCFKLLYHYTLSLSRTIVPGCSHLEGVYFRLFFTMVDIGRAPFIWQAHDNEKHVSFVFMKKES